MKTNGNFRTTDGIQIKILLKSNLYQMKAYFIGPWVSHSINRTEKKQPLVNQIISVEFKCIFF